ncbi:MAG: RHS repeat-associated core domain-containing protein [Firmicutes bacterium]|nr:RHS repeat-associated core domain-containing protein [Bacillota bacterium]
MQCNHRHTVIGPRATGKPFDEGTGLYYFGARYYDPEVGRFTSSDPAKDGLNWYGYADGNPLVFVDPDGRASTTAEPIGRYPSDVFTIIITALLAEPMLRTAITVKDLLWSKRTIHVDTMTMTE